MTDSVSQLQLPEETFLLEILVSVTSGQSFPKVAAKFLVASGFVSDFICTEINCD